VNMSNKQAPLTKKQIEFARRERLILDAAISLFEGPRWETVTVEQISRQAQIGKGTVYKHFTCKEEIYAHIAADFFEKLLTAYDGIKVRPDAERADLISCIQQIIRISFDLFLNNPVEAKLSFYCKRADFRARLKEELRQQFERLDECFKHYIGTILNQGVALGFFPDKPVEHLMIGLEATFDGAVSMIWNGDINCHLVADQESYVSIISEFMLAGLIGLNNAKLILK
jgi:AcrR family transcriptional regulator